MNALKSICIATILTLSLSISVAAGELNSPGYTAPPPPPPPPESNSIVDTISDPVIANILWLLDSIF